MSPWIMKQLHYQAQAQTPHLHESRLRMAELLWTRATESTLSQQGLESTRLTHTRNGASRISICFKERPMLSGRKSFKLSLLGGKSHCPLPHMAYRIKARVRCTVLSPYNWLYSYQIPCASLFPTRPLHYST